MNREDASNGSSGLNNDSNLSSNSLKPDIKAMSNDTFVAQDNLDQLNIPVSVLSYLSVNDIMISSPVQDDHIDSIQVNPYSLKKDFSFGQKTILGFVPDECDFSGDTIDVLDDIKIIPSQFSESNDEDAIRNDINDPGDHESNMDDVLHGSMVFRNLHRNASIDFIKPDDNSKFLKQSNNTVIDPENISPYPEKNEFSNETNGTLDEKKISRNAPDNNSATDSIVTPIAKKGVDDVPDKHLTEFFGPIVGPSPSELKRLEPQSEFNIQDFESIDRQRGHDERYDTIQQSFTAKKSDTADHIDPFGENESYHAPGIGPSPASIKRNEPIVDESHIESNISRQEFLEEAENFSQSSAVVDNHEKDVEIKEFPSEAVKFEESLNNSLRILSNAKPKANVSSKIENTFPTTFNENLQPSTGNYGPSIGPSPSELKRLNNNVIEAPQKVMVNSMSGASSFGERANEGESRPLLNENSSISQLEETIPKYENSLNETSKYEEKLDILEQKDHALALRVTFLDTQENNNKLKLWDVHAESRNTVYGDIKSNRNSYTSEASETPLLEETPSFHPTAPSISPSPAEQKKFQQKQGHEQKQVLNKISSFHEAGSSKRSEFFSTNSSTRSLTRTSGSFFNMVRVSSRQAVNSQDNQLENDLLRSWSIGSIGFELSGLPVEETGSFPKKSKRIVLPDDDMPEHDTDWKLNFTDFNVKDHSKVVQKSLSVGDSLVQIAKSLLALEQNNDEGVSSIYASKIKENLEENDDTLSEVSDYFFYDGIDVEIIEDYYFYEKDEEDAETSAGMTKKKTSSSSVPERNPNVAEEQSSDAAHHSMILKSSIIEIDDLIIQEDESSAVNVRSKPELDENSSQAKAEISNSKDLYKRESSKWEVKLSFGEAKNEINHSEEGFSIPLFDEARESDLRLNELVTRNQDPNTRILSQHQKPSKEREKRTAENMGSKLLHPGYVELENEEVNEINSKKKKKKKRKHAVRPATIAIRNPSKYDYLRATRVGDEKYLKAVKDPKIKKQIKKIAFHKPMFTYFIIAANLIVMIIQYANSFSTTGTFYSSDPLNIMFGPPTEALIRQGAIWNPCIKSTGYEFVPFSCETFRESYSYINLTQVRIDFNSGNGSKYQTGSRFNILAKRNILATSKSTTSSPTKTVINTATSTIALKSSTTSKSNTSSFTSTKENSSSSTLTLSSQNSSVDIKSTTTNQSSLFLIPSKTSPSSATPTTTGTGTDPYPAGNPDWFCTLEQLCGLGGFDKSYVPDQFYRFVTAIFIHGGVIHCLLATWAWYYIAYPMESVYGWFRIGLIYMLSGIGGNVIGGIFGNTILSVGSTGAILGVHTCIYLDLLLNFHLVPDRWNEMIKLVSGTIAALSIGLLPYIDNYANLGGIGIGLLVGLILLPSIRFSKADAITKVLIRIISIPLLIGLYIMIFDQYYSGNQIDTTPAKYFDCLPIMSWCDGFP